MLRRPLAILYPLAALWAFAPTSTAQEVDFVRDIQPILKDRCWSCHGEKKQEGEIRLDLKKYAFGSDEDLWVIEPGSAEDSILFERITLDADDEDVMPADGETLAEAQIQTLRKWIDAGAPWSDEADTALLAEMARRREREVITLPELTEAERAAEEQAIAAVRESGALAMRIAANTTAMEANFSLLGAAVSDDHLTALSGLEPTLLWLNLARTGVTDAGLAKLQPFTGLRRLNLANTAISDAGLDQLIGLEDLEYLNLYATKVGDAGIRKLQALPKLTKLYVWQTEVSAAGAKALQAAAPHIDIDLGDYATLLDQPAKPVPINASCPVTGKPVDTAISTEHQEQLVGFCCANCRKKFEADPTSFHDRIEGFLAKPQPTNEVCPVTGKPVDPQFHSMVDGQLIGFCCGKCKATFDKEPKKFADKLQALAVKREPTLSPDVDSAGKDATGKTNAGSPVNQRCPFSGRAIDPEATFVFEGQTIGFCCKNCVSKFATDPKTFAARVDGLKR